MTNFTVNDNMLNQYLQNKLSDVDTEQVELWLADHPEALEDLKLGEMFRQSNYHPAVSTSHNQSWFARLFLNPKLLISHALVFALGMFLVNLFSIESSNISIPNVKMFNQNRGSNDQITLTNNKDLLIQIPVDYISQSQYKIIISGQNNSRYLINHISAEEDIVSILLPKEKLKPGNYQLSLVNLETEDSFDYEFKVVN